MLASVIMNDIDAAVDRQANVSTPEGGIRYG